MTEKYTWPKIFYAPRVKETVEWCKYREHIDYDLVYPSIGPDLFEFPHPELNTYDGSEIEWVALRVEFDHIVEGER